MGNLSVRSKGFLVIGALILYAILLSVYAFHQKALIRKQYEKIQASMEVNDLLKEADVSAFYVMMAIMAHNGSTNVDANLMAVRRQYVALRGRNDEVQSRLPEFKSALAGSDAALLKVSKEASPMNMNQLMLELENLQQKYIDYEEQLGKARTRESQQLRTLADSSAMATLWFGILGLALLGFITGRFFRRLTLDLRAVQSRALEIVNGTRSEPLRIARRDEVGQLMSAVNSMAGVLEGRQRELLLERQKYFHQEKMAAIGTLAAGVAHEIGNPIAAIAGIAQEMSERCASRGTACGGGCAQCRPDLIHAQTQRLAAITREISELASPQVPESQLLDLNAHLRSTTKLIRYDKRLRNLELRLELDSQVPAIHAIADQLTQLTMNLTINAMDAVEDVQDRAALIVLSTRDDGDRVCMSVVDNGHGMDHEVLSRAFDAFYTTKPAGKGTGLGLALCYSIMQNHRGSIDIESTPGVGTRVQVFFPKETEPSEMRYS